MYTSVLKCFKGICLLARVRYCRAIVNNGLHKAVVDSTMYIRNENIKRDFSTVEPSRFSGSNCIFIKSCSVLF